MALDVEQQETVLAQISSIKEEVEQIRHAIIGRGVDVSASTPFSSYSEAINLIGNGPGTSGVSYAGTSLFPLPPIGNYGGGIHLRQAWKTGEVATLIPNEEAYPNTPTFIVHDQDTFNQFVSNSKPSGTEDYSVVVLKAGTYNLGTTTLNLRTTDTFKLFGENGAKITYTGTGTVIDFSSITHSDAFYVQNLVIDAPNALTAIDSIYLVRGVEITSGVANPIKNATYISRILINFVGNNINGAVLDVNYSISDVTIRSEVIIPSVQYGFRSVRDNITLLRCYFIGVAKIAGISLEGDNELVDRSYSYATISTIASTTYGIYVNGGQVVNSLVQQVTSTSANTTPSYGIYVENGTIKGSKVVKATLNRGSVLRANKIIGSGVNDVEFHHGNAANQITSAIEITGTAGEAKDNFVERFTKSGVQTVAGHLAVIYAPNDATIDNNALGDIFFSTQNGSVPQYSDIKGGKIITNNAIDLFHADSGLITKTVRVFDVYATDAVISDNIVGKVDLYIGATNSQTYNLHVIFTVPSVNILISNNQIGQYTVYNGMSSVAALAAAGVSSITAIEGSGQIVNNVIGRLAVVQNSAYNNANNPAGYVRAIHGQEQTWKITGNTIVGIESVDVYNGLYSNFVAGIWLDSTKNEEATTPTIDKPLYVTDNEIGTIYTVFQTASATSVTYGIYQSSNVYSVISNNYIKYVGTKGYNWYGQVRNEVEANGIRVQSDMALVKHNNLKVYGSRAVGIYSISQAASSARENTEANDDENAWINNRIGVYTCLPTTAPDATNQYGVGILNGFRVRSTKAQPDEIINGLRFINTYSSNNNSTPAGSGAGNGANEIPEEDAFRTTY